MGTDAATDLIRFTGADYAEFVPFGVVVADNPWPGKKTNGVRKHWLTDRTKLPYDTMSATDIMDLPVDRLAAPNAVLFMWSTWMHLPLAVECMGRWGFKYASGFPWLKVTSSYSKVGSPIVPAFGLGVWAQQCTELVLIGRRGVPFGKWGNPRPARKGIIIAERQEHSRKPEQLQDWVDGTIHPVSFPSPRLELFARRQRTGWVCWGDQSGQ